MGHSVKGIILKSFGISVSCHEVSIAECQTQLVVVSLRDGFVSPGCGSVMSLLSHIHIPNSVWDRRKSQSSWAFSFGWMLRGIIS